MSTKRRWKVLTVALSVTLAALLASSTGRPPTAAAAQTTLPCFAYILDGDVWYRCNGQTHQVTTQGDITDFAISKDTLALQRRHEEGDIESFPLDGRPGPILEPRGGRSRLYASCGTILHVRYGYDERGFPSGRAVSVLEVPGAKPLRLGSYEEFRCSSDRKVAVGTTDGGVTLFEGLPPGEMLAGPSKLYWYIRYHDYDVSPSGDYVAYMGPLGVYVRKNGLPAGQVRDGFEDHVSISDTGEVLYSTHWDEHTCSYKDPWHASLQPRPGYTEGDLCQAVAMWRPGLKEPEILMPLARHPQWVSTETAARLEAFSLRQGSARSDRPAGAAASSAVATQVGFRWWYLGMDSLSSDNVSCRQDAKGRQRPEGISLLEMMLVVNLILIVASISGKKVSGTFFLGK